MTRAILEAVEAAAHDLGRYVHVAWRWLPPGADHAERLEALRSDLLATRRGPDGVRSAPEVWARCRPALAPLADTPEVRAVDAAVARIAAALPDLAAGSLDPAALDELAASAREVAVELRRLRDRMRRGKGS